MHWPFLDFPLNFPPAMNKMNKEKTGKMLPVTPAITTFTGAFWIIKNEEIMERHVHENQNPYRSARNAATLLDYYPNSTLLETKPAKQRMSKKHLSFVVEWQMYNH